MIQTFYKQNPIKVDTPYREIIIENVGGQWQARLTGGTKWGSDPKPEPLEVVKAKTYGEAKEAFDKMFRNLQDDGWKAYSPYEPW
jgi:hypothetical protein